MLKEYLNDFCECTDNYLLYMGSYSQRGYHWQDESYLVNCYYCSKCGKELQIYRGYHDAETKKLYYESLKYNENIFLKPFVIDITQLNSDISYCSLEDKRNLINNIIINNGIHSQDGQYVVFSYKKVNTCKIK